MIEFIAKVVKTLFPLTVFIKCPLSEPAIACSKLTIETLKQDMKYTQS